VFLLIGILYAVSIIMYLNARWITKTFVIPADPKPWMRKKTTNRETDKSRITIISPHWE
jgi:hypothetical protein